MFQLMRLIGRRFTNISIYSILPIQCLKKTTAFSLLITVTFFGFLSDYSCSSSPWALDKTIISMLMYTCLDGSMLNWPRNSYDSLFLPTFICAMFNIYTHTHTHTRTYSGCIWWATTHTWPLVAIFIYKFHNIWKISMYLHSIKSLAKCFSSLFLVALSVLIGIVPSLLKLLTLQYFTSNRGNYTQIGNCWRAFLSCSESGYHA